MIHPDTRLQLISSEMGYGVVATEYIPKGTITWVLDPLDQEISSENFSNFDLHIKQFVETYAFRNNKGNYILCWDHGRYINHSFKPNCLSSAYNFEIAIRDIQPGEQLTDDYGYLNIEIPFKGSNEGTKRKTVYPDDLVKYHKIWDDKLIEVFKLISKVDQPLKIFLNQSVITTIQDIEMGKKSMKSILSLYYNEKTNS